MKATFQSVNFTADVKLLDFIQRKLDKLELFNDSIINGEVFLKVRIGRLQDLFYMALVPPY